MLSFNFYKSHHLISIKGFKIMKKLLIKSGEVFIPSLMKPRFLRADILIRDGIISEIDKEIKSTDAHIIDAAGMLVAPGFTDMHCHLREPGYEYKEDIESGTMSALAGGFTSIACMPNTNPVIDNVKRLKNLKKLIEKKAVCRVYPVAAATMNSDGIIPTDYSALAHEGAIAFSDDGKCIADDNAMRAAALFSAKTGISILCHQEKRDISKSGVMAEGKVSMKLCLPGIPDEAESSVARRDFDIAKETRGHIHFCHVSSPKTIEIIRAAKKLKLNITSEATPHHLTLSDKFIEKSRLSANGKMKPPLMPEGCRKKLTEAFCDNTIDCLATDHAPHSPDEKESGILSAPFGIIGFETAFQILYTRLVRKEILSLSSLLLKMTIVPSRILKIPSCGMKTGDIADLTIIDLNKKYTIGEQFYSKSSNSPFIGNTVYGRIAATVCRGIPYFFM